MPKEKSVGAVVFRKENRKPLFLLLRYQAGHWGFPKGHVEAGETEKGALLREIKEETSLSNVKFLEPFREETGYFFRRGSSNVFKEVVFFLLEAGSGKVSISFEHRAFQWLHFREAKKTLTFKNTRQVLEKANSFLQSN